MSPRAFGFSTHSITGYNLKAFTLHLDMLKKKPTFVTVLINPRKKCSLVKTNKNKTNLKIKLLFMIQENKKQNERMN